MEIVGNMTPSTVFFLNIQLTSDFTLHAGEKLNLCWGGAKDQSASGPNLVSSNGYGYGCPKKNLIKYKPRKQQIRTLVRRQKTQNHCGVHIYIYTVYIYITNLNLYTFIGSKDLSPKGLGQRCGQEYGSNHLASPV